MARKTRGRRVPATRRLTRAEAARVGVSYSAKRRVKVGVKVTRRTRLYTDREVAQSKIGVSKERYTKERVQVVKRKDGGTSRHYADLHKAQLMKLLHRYRDHEVTLRMFGARAGRKYDGTDGWASGPPTDADTLLDPEGLDEYLALTAVDEPKLYGLTVR